MKPGSRMRNRVDAVAFMKKHTGGRALVSGWVEMPFAEVCDWFGVENTMMLLFDEPEFVHEVLEFASELEIDFAKAQIDAGADLIGCGDAAASLISGKFFQEFALPYEQKVTKAIRDYGAYSKLHICGNTTQSLHLIAQCGASLVNIDSLVDFRLACEVFGAAGMPFKGNADPVRDLLNSTPEKAAAKGRELIRRAEGLPFMLSAGCEIPAAVSDEVYFAFADSVRG
jgi:MtaA/CmuA family methyltransferase